MLPRAHPSATLPSFRQPPHCCSNNFEVEEQDTALFLHGEVELEAVVCCIEEEDSVVLSIGETAARAQIDKATRVVCVYI